MFRIFVAISPYPYESFALKDLLLTKCRHILFLIPVFLVSFHNKLRGRLFCLVSKLVIFFPIRLAVLSLADVFWCIRYRVDSSLLNFLNITFTRRNNFIIFVTSCNLYFFVYA
jgi:hypothetical protein